MSVIIFIIILGVLVFVHELGHFLVAKKSGIRVDKFAVGFPPKIFSFKKGETEYALNLIPFGGYVSIFGETPDEESLKPEAQNSFVNKSKATQAAVLVSGVLFNIIFAWLLFSITFMTGSPSFITDEARARLANVDVVITSVLEESPASLAGLQTGDKIISLNSGIEEISGELETTDIQSFVSDYGDSEIILNYERGNEVRSTSLIPVEGLVGEKFAVGIVMKTVVSLQLPIHKAFIEGFFMTGQMTKDIAVGLVTFLGQAITGRASLDQVSGPVGIAILVDDASQFGVVALLGFTAFISLNLAVLNILPFPALDGGRLLFILIEVIIRRPIKPSVANVINFTGFAILILFMIIITFSDVIKLF